VSEPEKLRFRSKWTTRIIQAELAIEGKSYEVGSLQRGEDGRAVHVMEMQPAKSGEWYIHVTNGPKLVSLAFLLLSFEPADEASTCRGNA
jgi:hypothetical protein